MTTQYTYEGLAVRFWLGDEIVNPDTTGIGITVQRYQVTMLMAYLQHCNFIQLV
jgi:hypothetical protein